MFISCENQLLSAIALAVCTQAAAQTCDVHWLTSPEQGLLGSDNACLIAWDADGFGPRGTELAIVSNGVAAENMRGNSIMLWNGKDWSIAPGNPGFPPDVFGACSKAVFWHSDLTSTDFIFAAGEFRNGANTSRSYLYAYDRVSWKLPGGVGPNSAIRDLIAFDPDGPGPSPSLLVCCGNFNRFGNVPISYIACFDGITWKPLGAVHFTPAQFATVDFDGPGPALPKLFALDAYGGQEGPALYEFKDGQWLAVPADCVGRVSTIQRKYVDNFPMQAQELAIGGLFSSFGGVNCKNAVTWNGTFFSTLGDDLEFRADRFVSAPGSSSDSHARLFAFANSAVPPEGTLHTPIVAEWDGTHWQSIGDSGRSHSETGVTDAVILDSESNGVRTSRLFVTGAIEVMNGVPANHIVEWNGQKWNSLGSGSDGGPRLIRWRGNPAKNGVASLVGAGPSVLGGVSLPDRIGEWDGFEWTPIPGCPIQTFDALATFDPDGSGPESEWLIAAGIDAGPDYHEIITRWNGTDWADLGSSTLPTAGGSARTYCFASLPSADGAGAPTLYAAGRFASSTNAPEPSVASWTGSQWKRVGDPLVLAGSPATVYAMIDYDFDGAGPNPPKLVITGNFSLPRRVAVLEGSKFVVLGPTGAALDGHAFAIVKDTQAGKSDLYVGGGVGTLGNGLVFRWTGTTFQQVGIASAPILGMTSFALDPAHPGREQLVVVGQFTTMADIPANRIAAFDGTSWTTFSAGLSETSASIQQFGSRPGVPQSAELVVGGNFQLAGPVISKGWARLTRHDVPWSIRRTDSMESRCGDNVTIEATPVSGYSTSRYQWFHNGLPLVDGQRLLGSTISGSRSLTLTLRKLFQSDEGAYHIEVTGDCSETLISEPTILQIATCCPEDFNRDSFVDDADFEVFVHAYDAMLCSDLIGPLECSADLNNDSVVDDADFVFFTAAYHKCICGQ